MRHDEATMAFSSGRSFCDAAHILTLSGERPGRDYLALPFNTLVGISIETLYKAILLNKGETEKTLKGAIRHDLAALRDMAKAHGFVSKSKVDEVIAWIGGNYKSHETRYMKPNGSLNTVNEMYTVIAVRELVDEVAAQLGLPPLPK